MSDQGAATATSAVDPRLAESEERYRAVIENASDMIQSVRPDGTFEFVNRAWHETLGYSEDELAGLNIFDTIHPDAFEHCMELFGRAMKGEPLHNVQTTFVTKGGDGIPVEGSVTSRFVDGQIIATHAFFRDISERLRAQELEQRNAELERERYARYLEKMAALGKLSAGLAHELNNPAAAAQRASSRLAESLASRDAATHTLNASPISKQQWQALERFVGTAAQSRLTQSSLSPIEVSEREEAVEAWLEDHNIADAWDLAPGFVQAAITEEMLDELVAQLPDACWTSAMRWVSESLAIREMADVIARSSHRISELVGAVKAYSYMDRAAEQEVNIHDDLENTLIILAHQLKNVAVNREYAPDLPKINSLGSTLNQVWTNILDNAIDAMDGKGTITIRTRHEDGCVVVEIADSGSGIPADEVSRIFEPFYSTKPQGQGTGLGLDTVWRIVTEEHRGQIDVESAPGNTVFRVSLPVA